MPNMTAGPGTARSPVCPWRVVVTAVTVTTAAALLAPVVGAAPGSAALAAGRTGAELQEPLEPLPTLPRAHAGHGRPEPDRLLVKLSPAAAPSDARAAVAGLARSVDPIGGRWFALSGVDPEASTRRMLASTPGVVAVQPDRVRAAFGDPYYRRYQPYLRGSMGVNDAWGLGTGRGVTVAVLDTGVDVRHEDIGPTLPGRDFVAGDRVPQDPVGHGTFVAGIIAASRDNGKGVAGVSRATILPVRVLDRRGFGRDSTIAQGIRWAVGHGADIINLSLGGVGRGPVLRDAVDFADRRGVLVVASAGNDGRTTPRYPAAYEPVVAVGATDLRDRMVWWSEHGPWLDVVAPGVHIVSTLPGDRYGKASGTSFSAPLVSGAAALILGEHQDWTDDELRAALLRSAADAGPIGPDPYTGLGVPDVDGALGGAMAATVPLTGPIPGAMPTTAEPLADGAQVTTTSPEGTDRWFVLDVDQPTRIEVSAGGFGRSTLLRGDIDLTLYDAGLHRLDHADAHRRLDEERVRAVVDDTVYLQVRNLRDTRWPAPVTLGLQLGAASADEVETGGGVTPVVIDAVPGAETYGAARAAPLSLTTGVRLQSRSVDQESVLLLDGETGDRLGLDVTATADGWRVTPTARLAADRDYALVLDGVRTGSGHRVPYTRVGFRTAP